VDASTIRATRLCLGLTQAQLAQTVGVHWVTVSKWERGENAPDLSVLLELSQLFDVTCDTLLGREPRVGETFPGSVFCSALADFARDTSSMGPRDVALQMNGMLGQVTDGLLAFDGVPVKYTGDGLLGFFSGPAHATRAAQAAQRARGVSQSSQLTISLHKGEIFLGKIGHSDYARLDVIGDTVNVAFLALQWAVANSPGSICASAEFAAALGPEIKTSEAQAVDLEVLGRRVDLVRLLGTSALPWGSDSPGD
jgi:class 3 adenylate cyclase